MTLRGDALGPFLLVLFGGLSAALGSAPDSRPRVTSPVAAQHAAPIVSRDEAPVPSPPRTPDASGRAIVVDGAIPLLPVSYQTPGGWLWTRWVRVEGDLGAVLTRLLAGVRAYDLAGVLDRIERVAPALGSGDQATFLVLVAGPGSGDLQVQIRRGFGLELRLGGEGVAFRLVDVAVEAYWRETLGTIEGPVRISLVEIRWPRGTAPVLHLTFATVREFGCYGYRIENELRRAGDSLRLHLLGISPAGPVCPAAMAPAEGRVALDLPPGTHPLSIRTGRYEDRYLLVLSDSSVRLRTVRRLFTIPDTLLRWRYPRRSFVLDCHAPAAICERLRSWVVRRPGISTERFPPGGIVPYHGGADTTSAARRYFTFAGPSALEPIRGCFAALQPVLKGFGMRFSVELWTAERFEVWGGRSPGAPADSTAAFGRRSGPAGCLPMIPPPSVDSLAPPRLPEYGPWGAYGVPCAVADRVPERRAPLAEEGKDEGRITRRGGEIQVPMPIDRPPDRWREAAERFVQSGRARILPNTSRTARSRGHLHQDLRQWRCWGGETVGDVERHPGVPWYWVEHEGYWYYLLPETTSAAVQTYMTRVEERGQDLVWNARESAGGGPERVGLGPDGEVIPGFFLYLWRP